MFIGLFAEVTVRLRLIATVVAALGWFVKYCPEPDARFRQHAVRYAAMHPYHMVIVVGRIACALIGWLYSYSVSAAF
jgi:hypothetical protein